MIKTFITIVFALCTITCALTQTSYIQVNGEPDLSVYLNGKYKGETTKQLNGFIIENVPHGDNVIKITKENYLPFEETITVKPGEVLSYDVKPFKKQGVSIIEQGNETATTKTAETKTGKLIIQSLPIQIKITIPRIEGVNKLDKSKDQWIANDILEGKYKIIFNYNDKEYTGQVEINGDNT